MPKNAFAAGAIRPGLRWGSLQRHLDPLAVNERGASREGGGEKGEGRVGLGREGVGREGEGLSPRTKILATALLPVLNVKCWSYDYVTFVHNYFACSFVSYCLFSIIYCLLTADIILANTVA